MKSVIVAIGLAALFAAPAWAEQYWVSYEADGVYPEDAGWVRSVYGGGAQRSFDNGALVIDSRASGSIEDANTMYRPGALDPTEPDEWFVMSWRMRTELTLGLFDATVVVFSDERRAVHLTFSSSGVHVSGAGFIAQFAPGVFHDFEFRSQDMRTYALYLDGSAAYSGSFSAPLLDGSFVGWGDATSGGSSLTEWDFFRFGVTPEPCTVWLALAAILTRLKPRAIAGGA